MALYVVVHHQQDSRQPWVNSWLDNERLNAITTTSEIGRMCQSSSDRGERVFVHRCAWGDIGPQVVCSVEVAEVSVIDRKTRLVIFRDARVVAAQPPVSPQMGQNYYAAGAVWVL